MLNPSYFWKILIPTLTQASLSRRRVEFILSIPEFCKIEAILYIYLTARILQNKIANTETLHRTHKNPYTN